MPATHLSLLPSQPFKRHKDLVHVRIGHSTLTCGLCRPSKPVTNACVFPLLLPKLKVDQNTFFTAPQARRCVMYGAWLFLTCLWYADLYYQPILPSYKSCPRSTLSCLSKEKGVRNMWIALSGRSSKAGCMCLCWTRSQRFAPEST